MNISVASAWHSIKRMHGGYVLCFQLHLFGRPAAEWCKQVHDESYTTTTINRRLSPVLVNLLTLGSLKTQEVTSLLLGAGLRAVYHDLPNFVSCVRSSQRYSNLGTVLVEPPLHREERPQSCHA